MTVGAIVVAPIVEETCKGAAVLLVFLYRRREFDGVVDGIVYAGMAGIGFAFTENVLYLGRALADSGVDGLAATFVLRCIFGPFAHPLFTMATGVGFGIAVTTRRRAVRYLAPIVGWLVAVLLHASGTSRPSPVCAASSRRTSLLQVPIFVAALGFRALVPAPRGPADRPAPRGVRRDRLAHAGRGPDARLDAGPATRPGGGPASCGGPVGGPGDAGLPGLGQRAGAAARADDPRRPPGRRRRTPSATCWARSRRDGETLAQAGLADADRLNSGFSQVRCLSSR